MMKTGTIILAVLTMIVASVNVVYNEYQRSQHLKKKEPVADRTYVGEWVYACFFPVIAVIVAITMEASDWFSNIGCGICCIVCLIIDIHIIRHWNYFQRGVVIEEYGIRQLKDNQLILYEQLDLVRFSGVATVRQPMIATGYVEGRKYSFALEDEKQKENLLLHLNAEARKRTETLDNTVGKTDYLVAAMILLGILGIIGDIFASIRFPHDSEPYFLPVMMGSIAIIIATMVIEELRQRKKIARLLKEIQKKTQVF